MRAFAAVVDAGSFTRAAQNLELGRTRVTELVQQLEAHLRVRLLNRTTRKVAPTAEGAAYYQRVVQLLADLDDAEASLPQAVVQPRGRLRVDVPSPFARLRLVPALPDFHARYPDIQLHIGVSDREVDLISDQVDCVIRGGEPNVPGLVARPLGTLQLGFHAAPSYLAARGAPHHLLELEGPAHITVGFLRPRTGRLRRLQARAGDEQVDIEGRHAVAVDDGDAYLAAGLAGLGVVCLPQYMAAAHVASGELVPVLRAWQVPGMPMHLLHPPRRPPSQRLRVFADWVQALMQP